MTARGLARPDQIWVYDFVATSHDMPTDTSLAGRVSNPSAPPTPEEMEAGRKYGAMIAQELVKDIQAMGLPAIEAGPGSSPQVGDGVIRGYLVSMEGDGAGSTVKRMVIGFGAGTTEMDTVVEGYVMTSQGLRRLGSGTLTSSGNKSPSLVVPAAVAVATANPVGLIVVVSPVASQNLIRTDSVVVRTHAIACSHGDADKRRAAAPPQRAPNPNCAAVGSDRAAASNRRAGAQPNSSAALSPSGDVRRKLHPRCMRAR
jgi:hypothetical protein